MDAFDADGYRNELGVDAHADRIEDVIEWLTTEGLRIEAWYGVRVFTDPASTDEKAAAVDDLEALLHAEELAGSRDPYRHLAAQLHVIARRPVRR